MAMSCICLSLIKLCYVIKNIIGSEDTLMNKAERPSNFFFQHFQYNQAEQIKKGVILCPNFARNTPDLNTVESSSRLINFITHLSWSQ